MRASLALALVVALASCGSHSARAPQPGAGSTLDLRDVTAAAALIELGRVTRESVSVDADAHALASCARITLVSATPRTTADLVTMLDDAIRPAGLGLEHRAATITMHRTPGMPAPPGCATASAPAPVMPTFPAVPAEATPSMDGIVEGIRDDGNGHYRLSADAASRLRSSFSQLTTETRIVPVVRDGAPVGIRLYGIRRSTVLAALGFENGDTVTAVGGVPIHDPAGALEAYARLRGVDDTTVSIERQGQPRTLTYHVDAPP